MFSVRFRCGLSAVSVRFRLGRDVTLTYLGQQRCRVVVDGVVCSTSVDTLARG